MNASPSAADSSKISLRDVAKSFGPKKVLQGVDLDVAVGESMVVIGGSGSGKSVLLKCILGLMAPDRGSIRIDGEETVDFNDRGRARVMRKFGMLFQGGALFDSLRVWENVAFGPRIHGVSRAGDLDQVVERSLRQAALWDEVKDRLGTSALELSGGQQQRLCLARVLAVDPEVILMDEPCSALDPISTARIEELIEELRERYTVVIVTHNMQQAARVSDRTAFLLNGQLVEVDDTEKIFTTPADRRTEDYITGRFG